MARNGMPVDWDVAAIVGGRLVPPGPTASKDELEELVGALRGAAEESVDHVARVTDMAPADGRDLTTTPLSTVHVVDRMRWVEANTEVMAAMLTAPAPEDVAEAPTGHLEQVRSVEGAGAEQPGGEQRGARVMTHSDALAQMVGGAQVGAALAMVAGKVLGQLDPYASAHPATGRLLLVAPNILAVQRSLGVDPADFQLWVCLHEQTHALQFAAAPWLADHMRKRTQELLVELLARSEHLGGSGPAARGRAAWDSTVNFVRGGLRVPLMERFLTPTQRVTMADIGATMALLEGHADVVMDEVGPRVVPSVRKIRRLFDARRQDVRARDFVIRKVLGMDAKMAQYRDGAAFIRGVRKYGGWDLVNAVWTEPAHLPTAREIADPRAWARRVHG